MKALLVIDIQNDYFPDGKFPLEGADEALAHALSTIQQAREAGAMIVAVQHLAPQGAPFFEEGSTGAALHPAIAAATAGDSLVTKREADSFLQTGLDDLLQEADVRSEEHTPELQSQMRTSYAVFCLKKKTNTNTQTKYNT